jgi:hypothetical protein
MGAYKTIELNYDAGGSIRSCYEFIEMLEKMGVHLEEARNLSRGPRATAFGVGDLYINDPDGDGGGEGSLVVGRMYDKGGKIDFYNRDIPAAAKVQDKIEKRLRRGRMLTGT